MTEAGETVVELRDTDVFGNHKPGCQCGYCVKLRENRARGRAGSSAPASKPRPSKPKPATATAKRIEAEEAEADELTEQDIAEFYEALHNDVAYSIWADDRLKISHAEALRVARPWAKLAARYEVDQDSVLLLWGVALSRTFGVEKRTTATVIGEKGLLYRRPRRRRPEGPSEGGEPVANGQQPAPAPFRHVDWSEWANMSPEEQMELATHPERMMQPE